MSNQWKNTLTNENASGRFDRKLYEAACLSKIIVGEGGESFRNYNDTIQDGVLWLLSNLITEALDAQDEVNKAKREASV